MCQILLQRNSSQTSLRKLILSSPLSIILVLRVVAFFQYLPCLDVACSFRDCSLLRYYFKSCHFYFYFYKLLYFTDMKSLQVIHSYYLIYHHDYSNTLVTWNNTSRHNYFLILTFIFLLFHWRSPRELRNWASFELGAV